MFYFLIPFLMMTVAGVIVICVLSSKRNKTNEKIIAEGRKSTCVIEDLRHHIFEHGGATFFIVVSYKDDNGVLQRYTSRVSRYDYYELKKGMILECYVLGDKCYIDIQNIKVVEDK